MNKFNTGSYQMLRHALLDSNRLAFVILGLLLISAVGCDVNCTRYSCFNATDNELNFWVQLGDTPDSDLVMPFDYEGKELIACPSHRFDLVSRLRVRDLKSYPIETLASLQDSSFPSFSFPGGGPVIFDGIALELGKTLQLTDQRLSYLTLDSSDSLDRILLIPRSFEHLPAELQESNKVDSRDGTFGRNHFAHYFELDNKCFTTTRQGDWIFDVYRYDPDLIGKETSPEVFESHLLDSCQVTLTDGITIEWDGTTLNCRPGTPVSIQMSNNDTQSRPVRFQVIESIKDNRQLSEVGDSWKYNTWLGKSLTVYVYDVGGMQLGSCTFRNLEAGESIVWDGTNLICGPDDEPGELATVSVCNGDYEVAVQPVIFTINGPTNGLTVQVDDCLDFDVPADGPVTFQVFTSDGATLLGDCTLQSPSDGDEIYWDGFEVSCTEN